MSTWNGKFLSLKAILERVQSQIKGVVDFNIADAVEWAGEALELIRAPLWLTDKIETLEVENYRVKIPCDTFLILGIKTESGIPMRYSSDIYHTKVDKCANDLCDNLCSDDLTYTVNNDYIFTRFEEGCITLAHRTIPTDDNGWPLIPDDIKFKLAVQSYIIERLYLIALPTGKVTQYMHELALKDRYWYIAAAQSRSNIPSYDQMESIKNNMLRLIPKINHHSTGFASADNPEMRYSQNSYNNDRDHINRQIASKTIPFYFYTG